MLALKIEVGTAVMSIPPSPQLDRLISGESSPHGLFVFEPRCQSAPCRIDLAVVELDSLLTRRILVMVGGQLRGFSLSFFTRRLEVS